MSIHIVEDSLPKYTVECCLVFDDETGEFYVVASYEDDQEVLAYPSDEFGNVLNWAEVAGGVNMSIEDVLDQLSSGDIYDWYDDEEYLDFSFYLDENEEYEHDVDSWYYSDKDN